MLGSLAFELEKKIFFCSQAQRCRVNAENIDKCSKTVLHKFGRQIKQKAELFTSHFYTQVFQQLLSKIIKYRGFEAKLLIFAGRDL